MRELLRPDRLAWRVADSVLLPDDPDVEAAVT
jgi:hypothetical protein